MNQRWQGEPSQYPWEQDALDHIRNLMPERAPFAARQCFTFTGGYGHVRECDLLIATPAGLFLVEIKSHRGTGTNQGSTWMFGSGRSIENPLHLTDQKCKELRSRLQKASDKRNWGKVPFIKPVVFLSGPDLVCRFDDIQKEGVYGREGLHNQTKLPEIWSNLLGKPPLSGGPRVTPAFSNHLPQLLADIGVAKLRSGLRVGPYQLKPKSFDAGPTWTDYLAENTALAEDEPRRIRAYMSEQGATKEDRESTQRAARREYRALLGIHHGGIVRVETISDELPFGPALVFRHGRDWQRLDQYVMRHAAELDLGTRVDMVRQLTDALDHAHRNHLYHRALAARSVYVEPSATGGTPTLRIADWQTAASQRAMGTTTVGMPTEMKSLAKHIEATAGPYLAPEIARFDAEPAQLDVFGLGAITYLLLTGQAPAPTHKDLGEILRRGRALVPSAVSDDVLPSMDDLVRGATYAAPADRFTSVAEFAEFLDLVEAELTEPEVESVDALEARAGDRVGEYTVKRVLGKGGTAKALLVTDAAEQEMVLKVALPEAGPDRLAHEAAQLGKCHSAHIVRILKPEPVQLGRRQALVLELAGRQTLGHYLRHDGRLTIEELEAWSADLFAILKYLEQQGIWHRDIKPDNLGIRELPAKKKGRQLVLFDFSLADLSTRNVEAGTEAYLDPFIDTDRRGVFDEHAERYAAAVTLHEMASRELPSWGDGISEPKYLDRSEVTPQLAADAFEDSIRDGLVAFFNKALHRNVEERFGDLKSMAKAFAAIFDDLDSRPPATTSHTVGTPSADAEEARRRAQDAARHDTPLVSAGLRDRALSVAHDRLGISTVAELMAVPANRIVRLRGAGLGARNELVQLAGMWRKKLGSAEPAPVADTGRVDDASASVDEIVAHLVPKGSDKQHTELVRLLLALPDGTEPSPVPAWAAYDVVASAAGVTVDQVVTSVGMARSRWNDSRKTPGMLKLRDGVTEILSTHGRVMEAEALAVALLQARGSELSDPGMRLAYAAACVRAAVEVEASLGNPRLTIERLPGGPVLIATVSEDPSQPNEQELFEYAAQLGARAAELVDLTDAEPLPAASRVRTALHDVPAPAGMARLSDTDLVRLAAGASTRAAATPRLELYPTDMEPARAVRLTQLGLYLDSDQGIKPENLIGRVAARFPGWTGFPTSGAGLSKLLEECGFKPKSFTDEDGDLRFKLDTHQRNSSQVYPTRTPTMAATPREEIEARLAACAVRGGFLAARVNIGVTRQAVKRLSGFGQVTPVDVGAQFLAALREVWVAKGGTPPWETVLAADSPTAPARAKRGIGKLLDEVWPKLEDELRGLPGVVLLHDATPLARYPAGQELLHALINSARRPDVQPHGLWLVCPMEVPSHPAQLDDHLVGAVDAQGEQVTLTRDFVTWNGA